MNKSSQILYFRNNQFISNCSGHLKKSEELTIEPQSGENLKLIIIQCAECSITRGCPLGLTLPSSNSEKCLNCSSETSQKQKKQPINLKIEVNLKNPNSSVSLFGIYILKNHEALNNRIQINHLAPDTHSQTLFKGVLDDEANVNFYGLINIQKEAEKAEAELYNKNLILDNRAHALTKPELNILTNEVKCNHGATVKYLDKNELFYLNSRGYDQVTAKNTLIQSFVSEVLSK
jgi:hypothetical protein